MRFLLRVTAVSLTVAFAGCSSNEPKYEGYWKLTPPPNARANFPTQVLNIRRAGEAYIAELVVLNPISMEYQVQELAATKANGALNIPYRYNPRPTVLDDKKDVLIGGICNATCTRVDAKVYEQVKDFSKTYRAPKTSLSDFIK